MNAVDTALLDLTERLCRAFQVLTGRTNVWIAVQLTNLSIVMYFVWAALYFQDVSTMVRTAVAVFCAAVLYALTRTVFKTSIEASESNAYRRVAKGLRNPRRLRDAPLRIAFLTMSVIIPLVLRAAALSLPAELLPTFRVPMAVLTYSLVVLTTALLYVLGCDPLPPCPGKVREWLRGAAPAPLASSEAPPQG